jgi:hypothetical protein
MNPSMNFLGERVFVYRNLHKKCFSVKSLKTGRVLFHTDSIMLSQVTFRVGKAGRERVLREQRKCVHAGVVGIISDACLILPCLSVRYNPYKYSSFVRNDESPIHQAKFASIGEIGIFAVE